MAARSRNGKTSEKILDVAERLIQVRGYNGFSYADIALALDLTKASLHYHFPSKAELGRTLMHRYTQGFLAALADLDTRLDCERAKLEGYVGIYASVLARKRMCLCGMLAAEFATLPKALKAEVTQFFDANESWLAVHLNTGRERKVLRFSGDARQAAQLLVAGLEGAMMLARTYGDTARFEHASRLLLENLVGNRKSGGAFDAPSGHRLLEDN